MSRVSKKVRNIVYSRDGYQCISCGATSGLSLQHRKNAGMGGSKTLHVPSNLIVMCVRENVLLESDADFANLGRSRGWKIPKTLPPERIPVFYPATGELFLLDDEGGREVFTDDVPF